MPDCDKCNRPTDSRERTSIRCFGACKKVYHFKCIDWNGEKFTKLFNECPFARFVCLECQVEEHDKLCEGLSNMNSKMDELKKFVNDAQTNLEEKVIRITKHVENSPNVVVPTYADKLKCNPNRFVIVQPKETQDIKKTKEDIISKIDPTEIPVMGSRPTNKGGYILQCDSEEATKKIELIALEKLGDQYNIKVPIELFPRIKILGLTEVINEEDIVPVLKKQNPYLMEGEMKVITILKRRNTTKFDVVMEVDPASYRNVMEAEKLNVRFERCRVVEGVNIRRCYKCNGYAHKADECSKAQSCPKCAGEHKYNECKSQDEKCVNCKSENERLNLNLNVDHCVWNPECVIYKRKIMALRNKISYK